jgi:hypothetical protein
MHSYENRNQIRALRQAGGGRPAPPGPTIPYDSHPRPVASSWGRSEATHRLPPWLSGRDNRGPLPPPCLPLPPSLLVLTAGLRGGLRARVLNSIDNSVQVSRRFTLIAPAASNLAFSGRTPEMQIKEKGCAKGRALPPLINLVEQLRALCTEGCARGRATLRRPAGLAGGHRSVHRAPGLRRGLRHSAGDARPAGGRDRDRAGPAESSLKTALNRKTL